MSAEVGEEGMSLHFGRLKKEKKNLPEWVLLEHKSRQLSALSTILLPCVAEWEDEESATNQTVLSIDSATLLEGGIAPAVAGHPDRGSQRSLCDECVCSSEEFAHCGGALERAAIPRS